MAVGSGLGGWGIGVGYGSGSWAPPVPHSNLVGFYGGVVYLQVPTLVLKGPGGGSIYHSKHGCCCLSPLIPPILLLGSIP